MAQTTKIIAIVAVSIVVLAGIVGAAMFLMKDNNENKITIATSPDFPNYEYMYGSEFAGIDMDIIRAVMKDIGYEPEFKNVNFDSIVMSIQSEKYKIGASGITITEERAKKVLYSDPYIVAKQVILAKAAVTDVAQLYTMKIAVQTGTTGDLYVTKLVDDGTISDTQVVRFTTYSTAVLELKNGKVDCMVLDDGPAKAFANKESLTVSEIDLGLENENYGFIFSKGNTELRDKVNASIAKLKADGTIDKIIAYYADANGDKPSYFSQSRIGSASAGTSGDSNIIGGASPSFSSNQSVEPATKSTGSIIDDIYDSFIKNDRYKYIITGLNNTIIITLIALVIGLLSGIIIAIVRSIHDLLGKLKILNAICKVYITIIRGTPAVVQLMIIYFIIFATSSLDSIIIAAIAFGFNSAAYVAEIVRAGINAVPKGQLEAGSSLGLPFSSTMILVILPQAIKNILPALCNEGITLLKETSISGYIGITDLTRAGDIIRSQTFDAVVPLLGIALIYLVIVVILTRLVGRLERRLNANAV